MSTQLEPNSTRSQYSNNGNVGVVHHSTNAQSFELSYMHFDEALYETFLQRKVKSFLTSLISYPMKHMEIISSSDRLHLQEVCSNSEVICTEEGRDVAALGICTLLRSPTRHCRQRVRFALHPTPSHIDLNDPSSSSSSNSPAALEYAMWEAGGPNVSVEEFPIASKVIYDLMPLVLQEINADHLHHCYGGQLAEGLQGINYLSSTLNEVVMTLTYQRDIGGVNESQWLQCLEGVRQQLCRHPQWSSARPLTALHVIGRSKGRKLVLGVNYVIEHLHLTTYDQRVLQYKQVDDGFSNPNGVVNMKALDWLCHIVQHYIQPKITASQQQTDDSKIGPDLLEMYCGNGNHTVALSAYFEKVLAVEINDHLVTAAEENLSLNYAPGQIHTKVLACDSGKFASKVLNHVQFTYYQKKQSKKSSNYKNGVKLEESDSANIPTSGDDIHYHFGTVLVDPPRCGLDPVTLTAVKQYPFILYISCNPVKLIENLSELSSTHRIVEMAAFDHFAYTPHLEVGVLLCKY